MLALIVVQVDHFTFSSLQNMYKELTDDIPGFSHPGHGTLIGWANQGK